MMLMAISASVIQVIGFIPPYIELAKRGGRVIGISEWYISWPDTNDTDGPRLLVPDHRLCWSFLLADGCR
jgi:hypothetical protein